MSGLTAWRRPLIRKPRFVGLPRLLPETRMR
jgi:hypothetical protein